MPFPETIPVSMLPNPNTGYHCMVNNGSLHTKLHTHDCYECNIILEGCVKNNSEGTELLLKQGDVIFLAPGESHRMAKAEHKIPKILTLMVAPDALERCCNALESTVYKRFCASATRKITLSGEEFSVLYQDYQQLFFLEEDKKVPVVKILLLQILCSLLRRGNDTDAKGGRHSLDPVLRQMNSAENMAEGVSALVRLSNLSRGHLYRLMQKECHMTPLAYVTQLRMNYAANLLLYSDKDILAIAMEVGYFSVSHFIAQFKKSYGVPPKQYRLKNKPVF